MRRMLSTALLAAVTTISVVPAAAQDRQYDDRRYDDRHDHTYRGRDGRYYDDRCKKSNGTTGLVAGGAGGALAGHVLGGGTLGTVAGGVGGALLGRHLDKKHDSAQNRRNGC